MYFMILRVCLFLPAVLLLACKKEGWNGGPAGEVLGLQPIEVVENVEVVANDADAGAGLETGETDALETPDAQATPFSGVIGTWNLKAKPFPIGTKRVAALARGVEILNPDILILTEVGEHHRIFGLLKELNEGKGRYERYFFKMPGLDDEPEPQHELGIAFLCRVGVELDEIGFVPGSDLGDPTEYRKAIRARAKIGAFDFLLVGAHLKSGGTKSGIATRGLQCQKIADYVAATLDAAEQDVIVTGDFNMIPPMTGEDRDVENFKRLGSGIAFRFVDETLGNSGTHIGYSSKNKTYAVHNHLDGLAVAAENTREYLEGSVQIVPLHESMGLTLGAYHKGVSDHFPLVAKFDYSRDDD